ncbi:MAG: hypothetical protein ACLQVY_10310 [Limisphaerales bacterium]
MFDTLSVLPVAFWVVIAFFALAGVRAVLCLRDGSGLPMLAVLGTVAVWYVGDAFYNDYAGAYAAQFSPGVLQSAWWQVGWFVLVFLTVAPMVHRSVNARQLPRGSGIFQMFQRGVGQPLFQKQLDQLFWGCVLLWGSLAIVAAIRLKGEIPYYFFPFLGYKAEPWGRGRIGSGFDALLSVAFYLQQLAAVTFGVVAALATHRRTRSLALSLCLLAWPYFVFDRTRNTMLAVVLPAIISWVFLRLNGGILKKGVALLLCFLVINAWMKFIIANRSNMSITQAVKEKGFSLIDKQKVHNEGLNMYEELCWITTFIEQGTYHVNWGSRYFAEVVNVVPRSLWPGKPMIGIDYAIVRGQGGGTANSAGVNATISTGMIGQGVVNFGRFLGPAAVALLMSFWVAALARLDLNVEKVGRILLYAFGLVLTFNLGRDITLITLYPFVFGAVLLRWVDRRQPRAQLWLSQPVPPQSPRNGVPRHRAQARFHFRRLRFVVPRRRRIW